MPGQRDAYNMRTADVTASHSDAHPWCRITGFLPAGDAVAVHCALRGGGGISQPSTWAAEWDREGDLAVAGETADLLLSKGVAVFEIEYPNLPTSLLESRHWPTLRLPHTWRLAIDAIHFIQGNSQNGRITGTRSQVLPSDEHYYVVEGTSEGALMAAQIALAPRGLLGYDGQFRQSPQGNYARRTTGRVAGAICNDLPSDFRIYDESISGDGIQHFGVQERFYTDPFNNEDIVPAVPRWRGVSREAKRDAGILEVIRADTMENRSVGLLLNCSGATNEASYLNSGLTFTITGSVVGSLTGATEVHRTSDSAKTATVKLIHTTIGGSLHVYAEPSAATNLADWAGDLTFSTGATVAYSGGLGFQVTGADTRKQFLTREAALRIILDTQNLAGEPGANAFQEQPELVTPHPVDMAALVRWYREKVFSRAGRTSRDIYRLGSRYPAQISGDTPHTGYGDAEPDLLPDFYRGLGIPLEE